MAVVAWSTAILSGRNENGTRLAGSVCALASIAGEDLCVTTLRSGVGHIASVETYSGSLFFQHRGVRVDRISTRADREGCAVARAPSSMSAAVNLAADRYWYREIVYSYRRGA